MWIWDCEHCMHICTKTWHWTLYVHRYDTEHRIYAHTYVDKTYWTLYVGITLNTVCRYVRDTKYSMYTGGCEHYTYVDMYQTLYVHTYIRTCVVIKYCYIRQVCICLLTSIVRDLSQSIEKNKVLLTRNPSSPKHRNNVHPHITYNGSISVAYYKPVTSWRTHIIK